MFTPFWSFIVQHYPAIGIVIVAVLITFFATKWATRLYHRFEKTEQQCTKMEKELEPGIAKISTTLIEMNGSLRGLLIFLKGKFVDMEPNLFQSKSPISLTPIGNDILNFYGGKKYIDDNLTPLIAALEKMKIKSALDVENNAPLVLLEFSEKESFTAIKNSIYHMPYFKTKEDGVQVQLPTIITVMGIYLRDKYLEKHPELEEQNTSSTS